MMKTLWKSLRIVLLLLIVNVALMGQVQVGDIAPDFTVTDVYGNKHRLYDYLEKGQYVLLDFFYTTCGPCQYYAPQVNLAYEKYGSNTGDVFFMAIDYDDKDKDVLAYDETYAIKFPSVSGIEGNGNAVVSQYKVSSFPRFYLISPDKKIIDEITPPTLVVFNNRFAAAGIKAKNTTSVDNEPTSIPVSVYPNPGADHCVIDMRALPTGRTSIRVLDIMGREVLSANCDNNATLYSLSLGDITSGVYMVKIQDANGTVQTVMLRVV